MKKLIVSAFMLAFVGYTSAQNTNPDPSYSPRNYKHANKVRMARASKLDKPVTLEPALVSGGNEYKHMHNQSWFSIRGSLKTKPVNRSRVTSKHPWGCSSISLNILQTS